MHKSAPKFLILLLLFPAVHAHQFLPTDATLSVLSDTEYGMVVDVDVIELVQTVKGLEGEGDELVDTVRMLPFPELIAAIENSIANLKRDIVVYFDGNIFMRVYG